jgi:hypothetical protein
VVGLPEGELRAAGADTDSFESHIVRIREVSNSMLM